jgi:hypothetical protein
VAGALVAQDSFRSISDPASAPRFVFVKPFTFVIGAIVNFFDARLNCRFAHFGPREADWVAVLCQKSAISSMTT